MPTSTLYLTEPGLVAHKVDERLVVKKASRPVSDIPLINLKQVVVVGRGIEVTTEAMLALVEREIDLCFFSRSLKFRARVSGELSKYGELRFLQARLVDDPARQLTLARIIVQGKLLNQRHLLLKHSAELRGLARRIEQVMESAASAKDLDSLRGYEGQGAALYFEGLRGLIRRARELGFARREYYPAPDPVNALLSYGYSMLTREALAAVYLVGLDPNLGFFHTIDYGRPSIALDLIEEFRPLVVDALVLELLNREVIRPEDFEKGEYSVELAEDENGKRNAGRPRQKKVTTFRLKPEARNRFLELYERKMTEKVFYGPRREQHTYRRAVELQARQVARLILGETDRYLPVTAGQSGF